MISLRIAALAAGLLLSATAHGQKVIDSQLNRFTTEARSAGYEQSAPDFRGNLNHGASATHTIYLINGVNYRIRGVCDNDCPDLDLHLLDESGQQVASDSSANDVPEIRYVANRTGRFTLRVQMYKCTVNPCAYGVRSFAPM